MNVTVCAPVLDPQSRSRSVAAVLNAIAAASSQEPAPDLIVLPDCFPAGPAAPPPSAAMCVGFCETIGRAAREWGVWITVGHPTYLAGKLVSGATVFDPDADAFMHFPQPTCLPSGVGAKLPSPTWAVANTPLGRWALRTAQSMPEPDWETHDASLVLLPARVNDRLDVPTLAAAASSADCAVCFASPRLSGDDHAGPYGGIISAEGQTVALDRGAGTIWAALEIPVAAGAGQSEEFGTLE
ncbi:MAG TPA: hypothetical protein P5572_19560 [Phycisphaerae bacterium]|nr:hypothetical protein [Phycisphaerae bacterium]